MSRAMATAAVAVVFGAEARAAALLVTMTTGAVSVKDAAGTREVPPGGFPLLDGQTLVIPEGGSAVVLSQGAVQKINGPKSFTTRDVVVSSTAGVVASENALSRVMGRKTSVSSVGATRGGGGFSLMRPIEGTRLASLQSIDWDCTDCGEQSVEVIDLASFESVWEGRGTGHLDCKQLALDPGEYAIKVEEQYMAFTVVTEKEAMDIRSAISLAKGLSADLDPVARSAVEAGIWWQAGMPTEALYVLDRAQNTEQGNADLLRLKNDYQRKLKSP